MSYETEFGIREKFINCDPEIVAYNSMFGIITCFDEYSPQKVYQQIRSTCACTMKYLSNSMYRSTGFLDF